MGFHLIEKATEPAPETRPASRLSRAVAKTPIGAPFGKAILSSKYWDSETRTLAYQLRDYGPGIGRWLSRDPTGERADKNLNAFIKNNMLVKYDILGLRGNDPPSSVSRHCCEGKLYNQETHCCFKDKLFPVIDEINTSLKICCHKVQYDPIQDPGWGEQIYPLFTHCDLRALPCAEEDVEYTVTKRNSGTLDNGKECRCSNASDIDECVFERIPFDFGWSLPGSNCQSNTDRRLKKCCLQSTWKPHWYGHSWW